MTGLNIRGPRAAPEITGEYDRQQTIEAIKDWFSENFEDPAENTSYESAEGGYLWNWGGPYDAREEIQDHFPEVPQDIIDEAVADIETSGIEWAPSMTRLYDEDEDRDDSEYRGSADEAYEDLQRSLDKLSNAVAITPPLSSLIGDNGPPEAIGIPPYRDDDKHELENAISALREPPDVISREPESAKRALASLTTVAGRFKGFFEHYGKLSLEEFSRELGKQAAKTSIELIRYFVLWHLLKDSIEALTNFLRAVGL